MANKHDAESAAAVAGAARGSEARSEIHYPCVVDAKLLSALTMCGDAIIRDPRPDRIKHWAKLRARIHKQAKPLNNVIYEPGALKPLDDK